MSDQQNCSQVLITYPGSVLVPSCFCFCVSVFVDGLQVLRLECQGPTLTRAGSIGAAYDVYFRMVQMGLIATFFCVTLLTNTVIVSLVRVEKEPQAGITSEMIRYPECAVCTATAKYALRCLRCVDGTRCDMAWFDTL